MLNILKIQNKLSVGIFIAVFLFSPSVMAEKSDDQCDGEKLNNANKLISDVLSDKELGTLYLKYNKKNRLIWFESADHKLFYKLIKLEENADPGLVGEEGSIAFVTPEIINTVVSGNLVE